MDEMRLIDYLIEAVSGRTKRYQTPYLYTRFPNKRTDYLGIEKWLDENGFVKRELGHEHTPPKLFEYYKSTGRKCYAIGEHDPSSVFSYWIRIWDGNKLFLIRTAPRDMVRQYLPSSMALCTIVDDYKGDGSFNGKYIKFGDIKKYFDEAVVYLNESIAGRRNLPRMRHTEFPRDRNIQKIFDFLVEKCDFS